MKNYEQQNDYIKQSTIAAPRTNNYYTTTFAKQSITDLNDYHAPSLSELLTTEDKEGKPLKSANPSLFTEMPLNPRTIRAIEEIGYVTATDIQEQAIPLLLKGKDLIGRSRTGTGKTAAFGVPAIESINSEYRHAQVLVLAPTRELAMQISSEMKKFSRFHKGLSIATVYGGASMSDQIKELRQAQVVVGTPGRLMDHIRRKTLKLKHIHMVVLDEADEMLNMGFIEDIETILSEVPEKRQTVLFSATMSAPLLKISQTFLSNPSTVDVDSKDKSKATIEQTYYQVAHNKKREVLTLLMHTNRQRSIVFCNTKSMVDTLAESLRKQGFQASALHGDMTQAARSQVMQEFRRGSVQTLIATDVAARGIDVDDIDVVINYDLPQSFEYYIHRIGRTGRAGKSGLSQTLISNNKQKATLRSLMKYTGTTIEERTLPTSGEIMDKAVLRTAGEVQNCAKNPSGKSALKLVKSLLATDTFNGSERQVAIALAEMLMGGDEQFEKLEGLAASFKKTKEASSKTRTRNPKDQQRKKYASSHAGSKKRKPKKGPRQEDRKNSRCSMKH